MGDPSGPPQTAQTVWPLPNSETLAKSAHWLVQSLKPTRNSWPGCWTVQKVWRQPDHLRLSGQSGSFRTTSDHMGRLPAPNSDTVANSAHWLAQSVRLTRNSWPDCWTVRTAWRQPDHLRLSGQSGSFRATSNHPDGL